MFHFKCFYGIEIAYNFCLKNSEVLHSRVNRKQVPGTLKMNTIREDSQRLNSSLLHANESSFLLASAFYFKRAHKRRIIWVQLRRGLKVRLTCFKVITG